MICAELTRFYARDTIAKRRKFIASMTETAQKYEMLALFPLAGTEEDLRSAAGTLEDKLKSAGATVASSVPHQKGRLSYALGKTRQGYYHVIQFEIDPGALAELRRSILLSGNALRFTISKVQGAFRPFVPTVLQKSATERPAVRSARPERTFVQQRPIPEPLAVSVPQAGPAAKLAQEKLKPEEMQKKISMEELDKRLEEILGE